MSIIIPQHVHFFSKNLKYLLKKLGVNQTELADSIARKQTTVSNWINGVSVPDVDDLVKIYHYFGIGTDMLILIDLEISGIVTDKFVAAFVMKKKDGSGGDHEGNILNEPEAVFNQAVWGQLNAIDSKLDSIKLMTKKLVEKGKK